MSQTQKTLSPRALTELLALATIWGASFIANRLALEGLAVFTTVALRVAGAAVLLWAVVRLRGLPVPRGARIWAAFLIMGVMNNALPFTLITWGQLTIPSGLAAILNATTALFGVIVAALVFADERLTRARGLGAMLGFAGVVTVIGPAALLRLDLGSVAQLALIGASLSYAFAAAFARRALRGVAPMVSAAGMVTGASVVMLPLALAVDGMPVLSQPASVWGAVVYMAVMSSAVAYLLYYRVLEMAGAGNLTLVTLLIVPVAIVLGALVFDEVLPLRAYAGFALIGAGLAIIDGRLPRRLAQVFA